MIAHPPVEPTVENVVLHPERSEYLDDHGPKEEERGGEREGEPERGLNKEKRDFLFCLPLAFRPLLES